MPRFSAIRVLESAPNVRSLLACTLDRHGGSRRAAAGQKASGMGGAFASTLSLTVGGWRFRGSLDSAPCLLLGKRKGRLWAGSRFVPGGGALIWFPSSFLLPNRGPWNRASPRRASHSRREPFRANPHRRDDSRLCLVLRWRAPTGDSGDDRSLGSCAAFRFHVLHPGGIRGRSARQRTSPTRARGGVVSI